MISYWKEYLASRIKLIELHEDLDELRDFATTIRTLLVMLIHSIGTIVASLGMSTVENDTVNFFLLTNGTSVHSLL